MSMFEIKETDLRGAYLIKNFYAGDARGGFTKIFEKDCFAKSGIEFELNETFVSYSKKNVIRGLHFQTHNPQIKIVSVVSGSVWDVIVDLRVKSPTFKKWKAEILSAENHRSFYVPRGFAHGFLSMEEGSIVQYLCDGKYDRESDTGIIYNDSNIGIEWPIDLQESIHSERDLSLMTLEEYLLNPMPI